MRETIRVHFVRVRRKETGVTEMKVEEAVKKEAEDKDKRRLNVLVLCFIDR